MKLTIAFLLSFFCFQLVLPAQSVAPNRRLRFPHQLSIAFRQLYVTNLTTAGTAYSSLTPFQPGPNELILVASVSPLTGNATDPTSVTGNNMTYVKIISTNYNGLVASNRLSVWRSMTNNNGASGNITVTYAASREGHSLYVLGLSNCITTGANGADAIIQSTVATNATANPSTTMAALNGNGRSAVFVFTGTVSGNGGNVTTPETGWTEDTDAGFNTPATGLSVIHQLSSTDNTVVVTSSAAQWAQICLEIGAVTR